MPAVTEYTEDDKVNDAIKIKESSDDCGLNKKSPQKQRKESTKKAANNTAVQTTAADPKTTQNKDAAGSAKRGSSVTNTETNSPRKNAKKRAYSSDSGSDISLSKAKNSKKIGIGTYIRKQYEVDGTNGPTKAWFDGQIVEQTENSSRVCFALSDSPDDYYATFPDDELDAYAHAYNVHHSPQPKNLPGVGANVRVIYEEGWCNGTITSKTKNSNGIDEYSVEFEDCSVQKMGDEDVLIYAAEYERYMKAVQPNPRASSRPKRKKQRESTVQHSLPVQPKQKPKQKQQKQKQKAQTQKNDSFESIVESPIVTPFVGLKVRKYFFDAGWFEGTVVELLNPRDARARVRFSDGHVQILTYGEVHVASRAYLLRQMGTFPKIPIFGTRITKRFDNAWANGTIVEDKETDPALSWGKNKVVFDEDKDGDIEIEYMLDEEAQQCEMAYKVLRRYRPSAFKD